MTVATDAVLFARAAGGALLKGELVSDEGEENALNADLQPSVHWDQNAYDILVKQEGLRKQHSVRRSLLFIFSPFSLERSES